MRFDIGERPKDEQLLRALYALTWVGTDMPALSS